MQDSIANSMPVGLPGMLADSGPRKITSYINNSKQHFTVTITAVNTETTCTINGTAFTVCAGGCTKTKAELADMLTTAINAGSEPVTATTSGDTCLVEADVAGTAFTCVGTANCTVVEDIPNEAGINFGLCVVQDIDVTPAGNTDNLAHLPTLVAQITTIGRVLGVTVMTQALEQNIVNANNVGYPIASAMSVLRMGNVWVTVEDAVVAGGQAYVRAIAGAGEQLGAFRSDADGSDAGALPGSRYKYSTSGAGLTVLELNLPIT